jgi:hypothetical protein
MMRATARFHANLAARLNSIHQRLDPVAPDKLASPYRLLTPVNTVNLKDVLCQVGPNADKLHDGLLLFKPVLNRPGAVQ